MLDLLKKQVDVTSLSWFKTEAFAKYYFQIDELRDVNFLSNIYDFAKKNKLNVFFVGWWKNILFWFYEYDWIIIKNNLKWYEYDQDLQQLTVFSGEMISDVAEYLENIYSNYIWHRFIWLPGSVWGAVAWNAWCFWLQTSDNFVWAYVYDIVEWKEKFLNPEQMQFSYRSSFLKQQPRYFLIKAKFDLSKKYEQYHSNVDNVYFRRHKQPQWNSCGSFFKNPSKENPAWKLLEDFWFKGYYIGDAFFSDIHANFLMTKKDYANYNDLIVLAKTAQDLIYKNIGVWLQPEVGIIYNSPDKLV